MQYKILFDFREDINPLGVSKRVKNSLRKSIKHIESYDPYAVIRFISHLARLYKVHEDNIVVGNSITHIFSEILKMIKPETVLVPSPVSNYYRFFLDKAGRKILPYFTSINEDTYFYIDELNELIDKSNLILFPNPHNITGKILNKQQIEEVIAISEKNKKFILFDESLIEFTDAVSYAECVVRSDYSLIMRTFSTYHSMAGLPLGYVIGSAASINYIKSVLGPCCDAVPAISCYAAIVSTKDKAYRKRTFEYIATEKDYIKKRLKNNRYIKIIDRGCNFLLLEITGDFNVIHDVFYKRGIIVDLYHEEERSFIRLPVKRHKDNAYLVKSLLRLEG